MTVAFQHALALFTQLALADELVGYPSQLFVVPVDAEDLSQQVIEYLDGGTTAVVVSADAGQRIFIPPASRLRRRLDRLRGRISVRVETRPADGQSLAWRVAGTRAAFAQELTAG